MENTSIIENCKCVYCGNYHNYSPEMCKDMNKIAVSNRELSPMPPMIVIQDYKDQLQQIIRLLEDIKAK
jgi:hypothetical protein